MDQKILEKLVSMNTVSEQSNLELIDYLKKYLKGYGFNCKVIRKRDKANLWAYKRECRRIILAGHTDTVPPGDSWSQNPYQLKLRNGKCYGLGVCDMKGFIAIVLEMAQRFPNREDLAFLFTFNEETDFAGAYLIDERVIKSDDILILGEPTDNQAIFSHRGLYSITLEFQGKVGHGSDESNGLSAIEEASKFITQFRQSFNMFREKYQDKGYAAPLSSLNFGKISGGVSNNLIAEKATLSLEIRPSCKEEIKGIKDLVQETTDALKAKVSVKNQLVILPFKASERLENKVVARGIEKGLGASYATEAAIWNRLTKNIVILGPGKPSKAHGTNEEIDTKSVKRYETLLEHLIIY